MTTVLVYLCHETVLGPDSWRMASTYIARSLQKISKNTKGLSLGGWVGTVSLLWGQAGNHLKYSKKAGRVETSPVRRYLLVHHRSQPPSLLQEGKSLILTATGEHVVDSITVGVPTRAHANPLAVPLGLCALLHEDSNSRSVEVLFRCQA